MANIHFSNGYALMIGVGENIPVVVKDATAMYNLLVNPEKAAYPTNQVRLLTEKSATRQNILSALDELTAKINGNPEATAIIYFSGHGLQLKQEGAAPAYYLVPHDFNWDNLANTAISGKEFTERIEAIQARKLVVLLDCCHASGIPMLKNIPGVTVKAAPLAPELLEILNRGSGRVVVTSSFEDEYSYTGSPYSIFTTCLMEALGGKAAVKKDGFARILDIIIYVLDQVPQRAGGPQHPFVNKVLGLNDNFPLCYYAGGSKELPGDDAVVPAPQPSRVTRRQRERLTAEGERLEKERQFLLGRATEIRTHWIIEANPVDKLQLAYYLQKEEKEILRIETRQDEIDVMLQGE